MAIELHSRNLRVSFFVGLLKSEEPFVGVERRESGAVSPTKRIRQSPIFDLNYWSNDNRISSIFYCNYIRVEEISFFVGFLKSEEPFVGVERRKSGAVSPTKRIRQSPIVELLKQW